MANKRQRKKNTKKYGRGNTIFQFPVGEKTIAEYQRQVRNTRAKINRVKKNYGIDLTSEIQIPSLESFRSRREFNQWKQSVESFRNRANQNYQFERNQHGVAASKARLRRIDEKIKQAQKLADEQISKYENEPFISGGQEQGTVGLQRPNKTGIYRPNDFDFEDVTSRQRLDEIEESAFKKSDPIYYDERMDLMKENFITALSGSFNSLADELIQEIEKIPSHDFYQMYLQFDEFDFDYFDTDGQNVESDEKSVGQMMKYIERYKDGKIDGDMWHKNFS